MLGLVVSHASQRRKYWVHQHHTRDDIDCCQDLCWHLCPLYVSCIVNVMQPSMERGSSLSRMPCKLVAAASLLTTTHQVMHPLFRTCSLLWNDDASPLQKILPPHMRSSASVVRVFKNYVSRWPKPFQWKALVEEEKGNCWFMEQKHGR